MRQFILIFLTLISLSSFAQKVNDSGLIKYRLFIYHGCEDTIKMLIDYTIENRTNGLIIDYKPDSLGYCTLPKDSITNYFLNASLLYINISIDKSKEIVTDTITIEPIYKAPIRSGFYIGPTYYQYYKCGEQCDGFQKVYRKDGQLWQRGHFKRGKLKSLKSFYPNGLVQSIIKDRLFNGCDVIYDKSGILTFRLNYFLFISHYRIFDDENRKYVDRYGFGQYK
jgi:hypothetical protein